MLARLFAIFLLPLLGFDLIGLSKVYAQESTSGRAAATERGDFDVDYISSMQAKLEGRDALERYKEEVNRLDGLLRVHARLADAFAKILQMVDDDLKLIDPILQEWDNLKSAEGAEEKLHAWFLPQANPIQIPQQIMQFYNSQFGDALEQWSNQEPAIFQSGGLYRILSMVETDENFEASYKAVLDEANPKTASRPVQKDDACAALASTLRSGFNAGRQPTAQPQPLQKKIIEDCRAMKVGDRLAKEKQYWKTVVEFNQQLAALTKRTFDAAKVRLVNQGAKVRKLESEAVATIRNRTLIDGSALQVILGTLVAWTCIIGVIVYAIIKLAREGAAGSANGNALFNYGLFLEMTTVFILTATILILGLAGKLSNEVLGTLIGGISGYVLGRMTSSTRDQQRGTGSP